MKKITFLILATLLFTSFGWQANAQYCAASGGSTTFENISNVTYAGISNTTSAHTGYNDFTAQIANVTQGAMDQISVTLNADSSDYLYAFIDWNQNDILDDAGEVYTLAVATSSDGPHTLDITVPAAATVGNTRMRVRLGWNQSSPNPCGNTSFGEVEDYTVNVQAAGGGGSNINECASGLPLPIDPPSSVTSTVTVTETGVIGAANGDYNFDDVMLNVGSGWASDLTITLVSPSSTSLVLTSGNGGIDGLNPAQNLMFTDSSANDVTTWGDFPPLADYQAQGGLFNTVFAGEPVNGVWTLNIVDAVSGDGGSLNSFCLNMSLITVVGNAPTIACPADITINNAVGTCGAVANFAGVAFDVEDGNISGDIIATPASGSTFPVGDTMVELSVTDSDGNTVTCNFMVTVVDNEAPVAVCQDITVDLDPVTGMATITGADVDNGSTDNCGIASMTLDISSFDCSMTGANTVILTVTDNSGNSSTCTSTVTVQDVTAPEIVCIGGVATITESEDFEGSTVPAGWSTNIVLGSQDWTFGSGDMPTGGDFPTNAAIFDDDAVGSGDNIAELLSPVYDLTGATSAEISFDYALQDFVGLGLLRGEVWDGSAWQEVFLADNADIDPVNTGAIDVLAYANAAFQVKFTWDDETGWNWGAGVDNFLLTYEASSGGGLDVYLDANGMASVDPNDLLVSVNEACGYTISAGGVGGGSSETLPTGFAGGNGNFGNMFDVNAVTDVTIDSFDINADTGATFDVEVYAKTGTWVGFEADPSAWTLIGTAVAVVSNGDGVATPLNLTLNYVMAAGETHAFYVTPTDFSTGGLNYTNGTGTGNVWASDANIEFLEGGARGYPFSGSTFQPRVFNGNIHYTTGGGSGLDFTCADLGENIVEVTVTDDSGNSSTCFATVNVIDNIAPILVCQDTTIELGPDGTATVDPMALLATLPTTYEVMVIGSDNQSGNEGFTDFTVNVTEAANVTFDWDFTLNDAPGFDGFGYLLNGTYTQLTDPLLGNQSGSAAVAVAPGDVFGFRAQTDDNLFGNTETVISNFMPGFDGQFDPANWMLTLTESDGDAFFTEIPGGPLSFDACGITVLAVDVTEVSCADIGTPITVTVFASDASGNIASCTSVITVVDLLGPELTCPADQTVDPGAGNLFYILPDYFATGEAIADDNCTDPVTILSQDPAPGTPLSDGTYTITMTATDEYGNVSTCSFELTVETTIGVDENSLDKGLALYPNPADNVVNLVNKTNISLEKMMIYDINGKLVNQTDLRTMQGVKAVDVSSLASGVYMVQIIGDSASTVKRLIKE
ncbi:GEVED domain-containing protein [Aequorivita nionensis]|uniref:GEVED domain-containing protein n=1 Tax=Aequorivita nionensis TaxID=1287690 RepID=UPI003965B5E8